MSNDYQHKGRKRRSLERKVSAHSSEEREREKEEEEMRREEKRDKCMTKEQGRQKSQIDEFTSEIPKTQIGTPEA